MRLPRLFPGQDPFAGHAAEMLRRNKALHDPDRTAGDREDFPLEDFPGVAQTRGEGIVEHAGALQNSGEEDLQPADERFRRKPHLADHGRRRLEHECREGA